ncbi:MAG: hypothetical protein K2I10_05800 [Lachnospiraceae bacterium]|nr:hypothetical protein [Lachnospiraceae bacterium]
MADEATIIFNYEKAIKQADELVGIAKEVRKVVNANIAESLTAIDKNWDGENSVKFIKKGNVLKGKISDSADDIEKIAGDIRIMAKRIYDAEMEAIRIARQRAAAQ